MQILNVRLGLATNSSSAHSLIFLDDGVQAEDYMGYRQRFFGEEENEDQVANDMGDYGWQCFTAASKEAKLIYLAIMLRDKLSDELPWNIANLVCKNWLDGLELPSGDEYIDHQSMYNLPLMPGTNIVHEEFFKELKDYFLRDNMVVLGGNDNDDDIHPLKDRGEEFTLPLPLDHFRCKVFARKDPEYNYWTVFNSEDGTKVRFRLTDDPKEMEDVPNKAFAPELVDIKITDYCPIGCSFCYQASTIEGSHADSFNFYTLSRELSDLEVFEVAIGGGEPTMHPSFIQCLDRFRDNGVIPNFTTRSLAWLHDNEKRPKIIELCGAFAFSVSKDKDIKKLATLIEYHNIPKDKCNLHVVMGTIDKYNFNVLLKEACKFDFRVTLLGFKDVGFGEDFRRKDYDWWLDEIQKLREHVSQCPVISIDTVLAAEYEQQILNADIPRWLFNTQDGTFSCYIDAVKMKIGPSSYCKEEEMIDLTRGSIRETFASFSASV